MVIPTEENIYIRNWSIDLERDIEHQRVVGLSEENQAYYNECIFGNGVGVKLKPKNEKKNNTN